MIGRWTMFKVFLNSFFIQAAWSFEKMQGLGFAAAIAPAIKDIYKDKDETCSAMKRHMVFYNAHPYMASPILGAVIRMEQEVKEGKRSTGDIASFKESLMGPYGAIGDTFFWGSVRPLASIVGVLSALIWGLWGIGVFLVVYNIFHLWMRWFGLKKGYELGGGVVEYIKSLELPTWSQRVRLFATGILGILVAALIFKFVKPEVFGTRHVQIYPHTKDFGVGVYTLFLITGFTAALIILSSSLLRKGLSVSLLIYLLYLVPVVFLIIMNILFQRIG